MSNTDIHLSGPRLDRQRDAFTWTATVDPGTIEPKDVAIIIRFKAGTLAGESADDYREEAEDVLNQVANEIIKGKT